MGADDHNVEVGITGPGSGRPPASRGTILASAAAARSRVGLPREQRRARRIAMGKAELDAFLTKQRTCRVATASQDGPHLTRSGMCGMRPRYGCIPWSGASAGLTLAVTGGLRFSSTPATRTANCAGLNCAARSRSSARYRGQGHPTPGWRGPSGFTPASTKAPA